MRHSRRRWRERFDVLACPDCGGRLRLLATIEDRAVVEKILTHLGLPVDLPQPAAARTPEWLHASAGEGEDGGPHGANRIGGPTITHRCEFPLPQGALPQKARRVGSAVPSPAGRGSG